MNAPKSPAGPGQFNCYCGKTHPLNMLGRSFQDSNHDAPVTRPDLDALIGELQEGAESWRGPGTGALLSRAAAALAAERARADQAWRAAIERAQDELVRRDCFSDRTLHILDSVRDESPAPTAEQES